MMDQHGIRYSLALHLEVSISAGRDSMFRFMIK